MVDVGTLEFTEPVSDGKTKVSAPLPPPVKTETREPRASELTLKSGQRLL